MLLYECHQQEALKHMRTIQLDITRERQVGRRGSSGKWPVLIVLLIYEILLNGTPPSAVPANANIFSAALAGTVACEVPSVEFVPKYQVVLQTVNKKNSDF